VPGASFRRANFPIFRILERELAGGVGSGHAPPETERTTPNGEEDHLDPVRRLVVAGHGFRVTEDGAEESAVTVYVFTPKF
jgi:hypothetical protein